MSRTNTTPWVFEDAELVLLASYKGLNPSQIVEKVAKNKNIKGVSSFISNFRTWYKQSGDDHTVLVEWMTKNRQNIFKAFVEKHPNEIPLAVSKEVQVPEAENDVVEVNNTDNISKLKEKEKENYDALESLLSPLGSSILTYAQSKVDVAIAEERKKTNGVAREAIERAERVEEQLKATGRELEELRVYKAKMQKKLQDFFS